MTHSLARISTLIGFIAIAGFALLASGCSTGGAKSVSGLEVSDSLDTFRRGELRLTCETACSGSWGSARRTAKSYFDNALWTDLATEVARVGHRVDLTYFYLGRAAEGLGLPDAARTYYRIAMANPYKCKGMINNCDGFDVPYEIKAGLERLPVNAPPQTVTPPNAVSNPALPLEIKPSASDSASQSDLTKVSSNPKERQKVVAQEKARLQSEAAIALEQEKARKNEAAREAARLRREEVKAREEERARQKAAALEETKARAEAKALEEAKAREEANARQEAKAREEAKSLEEAAKRIFVSPTPEQRSKIISAIKEPMFDPYSAVIEEMSVLNNKIACAGVNGKNRFGGYVGKKQALVSNLEGHWILVQTENMSHANCKVIAQKILENF